MAFNPSLVPSENKLILTLVSSPISSDQTDFPLIVHLDDTDPLHAAIFTELGSNSKKLSIEYDDSQCPVEIENWQAEGVEDVFYSGIASASSEYSASFPANDGFDKNDGTRWSGEVGDTVGAWLKYELLAALELTSVSVKNYTNIIKDIKIQGSNDDSIWNDLLSVTLPSDDTTHNHTLTTTGVYKYYRLLVVSMYGGAGATLWEFKGFVVSPHRATLHAKVPTYSSSTDTELVLSYDSSQDDNDTYVGVIGSTPAQSVWDSNFVAAYHMAQDPSGGAPQITDSTGTYHLTSAGSMTSDDLVDGDLGKAIDFDGANDYLYNNSLQLGGTLSAVFKIVGQDEGALTHQGDINVGGNQGIIIALDNSYYPYVQFYSGSWRVVTSNIAITSGVTTISVVISGTSCTFTIDGVADPLTMPATVPSSTAPFQICVVKTGSGITSPYAGRVEECTYSTVARSDDWSKLVHLSLTNQLTTWSSYTSFAKRCHIGIDILGIGI